ncbi:hypothetical protein Tco_0780842 [Tanacetum coccineum]
MMNQATRDSIEGLGNPKILLKSGTPSDPDAVSMIQTTSHLSPDAVGNIQTASLELGLESSSIFIPVSYLGKITPKKGIKLNLIKRENRYLEDIIDLEKKLSSHDRIVYKMGQSVQTIHMLGKRPNKVYDPFFKAGLGYQNLERLKKANAAQPKMYHGEMIQSTKLKIVLPDSEETLEDAEEIRLKMRNKMVQPDYGNLNALYETFVSQKESSVEKTYLSIPSTSNICSESNEDRIDVTLLEDRKRRWMSDSQNSLREFYKSDVIPISVTLSKTLKELQQELIEEKHEFLENEIKKISSDSKDIQANLLKRIKILKSDFKRSQAQSIHFELKLEHQKGKMDCGVSWKSRLSKLSDVNVLLKTQVDYVVQERENIKLEYQKLFNSIKATRAQHQQEVNELVESISQKTYAYGDVRSKNQDLLMLISDLKEKLKTLEKGKGVNTKFDKSMTSRKLLCATPLPNKITVQAKKVSNSEDKTDRSKPVTSHSTPKNKQN